MTEDIKNKICQRCKRRKFLARAYDQHFDWRDCPLECDKKCVKQMKVISQ